MFINMENKIIQMAKKAKEEKHDFWSGIVLNLFKDSMQDFVAQVRQAIFDTEDRILNTLYAGTVFIVATIFILIAFVLLLSDYTILTLGWSFMFIGLLALVAVLLFKQKSR